MMGESVNRSFNQSPTSGVIHRQRDSYGPRLTLLNRSKDESLNHNIKSKQIQSYLQSMLLLAIQIERLNDQNDLMKKSFNQQMNQSQLISQKQFKQTNQSLQEIIRNMQKQLIQQRKKNGNLEIDFNKKISQFQTSKNYLIINTEKLEKQLQLAKEAHTRQKLQQSKIGSQSKNLKIDNSTFKSIQQKNNEIFDLRQIIKQYEYLIKDQKNTIYIQKDQIKMLKTLKQQVQDSYDTHLKQIQSKINYQLVDRQVNTQSFAQVQKLQELQLDLHQLNNQLRLKESTIYELSQNNSYLRQKYVQLQSKYYDLQFSCQTNISKIQEQNKNFLRQKSKQIQQITNQKVQLLLENQSLQKIIQMFKNSVKMSNNNIEKNFNSIIIKLQQDTKKLRNKDHKKTQKPILEQKSSKSIQQTSFFYRQNPRFKRINLESTISSVQQLGKSVQKNQILIGKSFQKLKINQKRASKESNWKSQQTIKIGKQNIKTLQIVNDDKSNNAFEIYYKT